MFLNRFDSIRLLRNGLVSVMFLGSSQAFAYYVAVDTHVTMGDVSEPGADFNEYWFGVDEDALKHDGTCFSLRERSGKVFPYWHCTDQGAQMWNVEENDILGPQTADDFPEFMEHEGFDPFYVGLGLNWAIDPTGDGYGRSTFGWMQLQNSPDGLLLLGSAIAYGYAGIVVGTDNPIGNPLVGDFDGDGFVSEYDDLDLLRRAVIERTSHPSLDVNADGSVDAFDQGFWMKVANFTYFGDTNLDGEFSGLDLASVFADGRYEDGRRRGYFMWDDGDWNGDGYVNSSDLVLAFADGGYEQGPRVGSPGDANGDGQFDVRDLTVAYTHGTYETPDSAGWTAGDWNRDRHFDTSDLVAAFQVGGYEAGPRLAGAVVPEPTTGVMGWIGFLLTTAWRRR